MSSWANFTAEIMSEQFSFKQDQKTTDTGGAGAGIQSSLEFVKTFSAVSVIEGEQLILECQVRFKQEDLHPVASWRKNGVVLVQDSRIDISANEGLHRLAIDDVKITDGGDYEFVINNGPDELSCKATIVIEASSPPDISKVSPTIAIREENDLVVQGTLEGRPFPDIQVWKQGGRLIESDRTKMTTDESKQQFEFKIARTQNSDGGRYKIIGTNKSGFTVHEFEVVVAESFWKWILYWLPRLFSRGTAYRPIFLHALADRKFIRGSSAILSCLVDASPAASITWLKNDIPMQHGGRIDVQTMPDGSSKLSFKRLLVSDIGRYSCVAENKIGRVETTCRLSVEQPDADRSLYQLMQPASNNDPVRTFDEPSIAPHDQHATETDDDKSMRTAADINEKTTSMAHEWLLNDSEQDGSCVVGEDDMGTPNFNYGMYPGEIFCEGYCMDPACPRPHLDRIRCKSINSDDHDRLDAVRSDLMGVLPSKLATDVNLHRWLVAFDRDVDETARRLRTFIVNRHRASLDEEGVFDRELAANADVRFAAQFFSFSDLTEHARLNPLDNNITFIIRLATIDFHGLSKILSCGQFLRLLFVFFDVNLRRVLQNEKESGRPSGINVIVDMENFSLANYADKNSSMFKIVDHCLRVMSINFPGMIRRYFLINAPFDVMDSLKRLGLTPDTIEMIVVISDIRHLSTLLDPATLPRLYGGPMSSDLELEYRHVNFCGKVIHVDPDSATTIPRSIKQSDHHRGGMFEPGNSTTIYLVRHESRRFLFRVITSGTIVRWRYLIKGDEQVNFALIRSLRDGREMILTPFLPIITPSIAEYGQFTFEEAGAYGFLFFNSGVGEIEIDFDMELKESKE